MDIVTINGVDYQRISSLTKRFRYTADYIGQLCRSNKVDAQLVGRSWYVNPISLQNHKNNRFQKTPTDEKTFNHKVEINKSRMNVEPVVTKNAARTVRYSDKNFFNHIHWKSVKYSSDENELLPEIKSRIKPVNIKVDLADATTVNIHYKSEATTLIPESLPTVSLSGKLKVNSLNKVFEEDKDEETIPKKTSKTVTNKPRIISNKLDISDDFDQEPQNIVIAKETNIPLSKDDKDLMSEEAEVVTRNYSKVLSILLISLLILILVSLLTVDLESVATETSYTTKLSFSLSDFFDFFR